MFCITLDSVIMQWLQPGQVYILQHHYGNALPLGNKNIIKRKMNEKSRETSNEVVFLAAKEEVAQGIPMR